ncbi:hypothetical protein T10_2283 [Trichinella papuae]|uniref:Uncharacterized protein n=1 Tax=Trichinella papuae TaxID=268474 RepID=A0A0V1M5T7_9BILA|nr:hypothetical protein T10_2283 [Trichinella papuae]
MTAISEASLFKMSRIPFKVDLDVLSSGLCNSHNGLKVCYRNDKRTLLTPLDFLFVSQDRQPPETRVWNIKS